MIRNTIFAGVLSLLLASCAESTLYSWYKYEDTTYKYTKVQTNEQCEKVLAQYQKMSDKQKGIRATVPPGLCAEYGYMLIKKGEVEKGLELLKKEIALYPESTPYISVIIKQIEKNK